MHDNLLTESGLQAPLLHLNGSGKEGLTRPLEEAYSAILTAQEALRFTAPHGRDYYPLECEAIPQPLQDAIAQHRTRQERLESVKVEILEIFAAIDRQGR